VAYLPYFQRIIDLYVVNLYFQTLQARITQNQSIPGSIATNKKCPILHLGRPKDLHFSKALYVKNNQGKIGLKNTKFLNKYFLLK
jgi:hypothetical protein